MNGNDIDRRSFLKVMGWGGAGVALSGCDMPTTVTLEEGKETVVSYLMPEEYVIPGQGVTYASTCQQCGAGCGLHGRVREGRVLKLEGNPASPINHGRLCQMGQAGLQNHYNPDRIKSPMLRKGGSLVDVSWDEAMGALKEKMAGVAGDRITWLTGTVSGHQSVLLKSYMEAVGSKSHFVSEVVNSSVAAAANTDLLGVAYPTYRVGKAKAILSLGADLVGASISPVHFSTEYVDFRSAPRGVLVQAEPKMSLTGANADRWLAVRPGTEGVLAMGIANLLLGQHGKSAEGLSAATKATIASYDVRKCAGITGVSQQEIEGVAKLLAEVSPSLVLTGASAEGHEYGYHTAAAAMMLNVILGNVGKTVVAFDEFPFAQLVAKPGNGSDLLKFAEMADKGAVDVAFIYGVNPVYTAPSAVGFTAKFAKVKFKVSLNQFFDETARDADLILPLASALEDWGTHVPVYQPDQKIIAVQQPLMERLYPNTRGFGDTLLTLLKAQNVKEYEQFTDYYSYLHAAITAMPAEYKGDASDKAFWEKTLQTGVIAIKLAEKAPSAQAVDIVFPEIKEDAALPLRLIPSVRLGLWDGRHANIPWLQEAPDQVVKAVWGSWAEIHPKTADRIGVKSGDFVTITSLQGAIDVPVYVYRGVHPDAIAVPIGQGHEEYGRYAKGLGVNPLKILSMATDAKTGDLATHATRVSVAKSTSEHAKSERLVRFGGSESQVGRKLVASVTADRFNRTEGA